MYSKSCVLSTLFRYLKVKCTTWGLRARPLWLRPKLNKTMPITSKREISRSHYKWTVWKYTGRVTLMSYIGLQTTVLDPWVWHFGSASWVFEDMKIIGLEGRPGEPSADASLALRNIPTICHVLRRSTGTRKVTFRVPMLRTGLWMKSSRTTVPW